MLGPVFLLSSVAFCCVNKLQQRYFVQRELTLALSISQLKAVCHKVHLYLFFKRRKLYPTVCSEHQNTSTCCFLCKIQETSSNLMHFIGFTCTLKQQ